MTPTGRACRVGVLRKQANDATSASAEHITACRTRIIEQDAGASPSLALRDDTQELLGASEVEHRGLERLDLLL
jgi:hypothetical protein